MKKIFTLLCGIAFAAQFTTVSAQSTTKMKVYTTDGNVVEYSTSEVDSVTFSAQEDTYAYKIINGHKFINLGLSVLWAETNIGAESAEDYGNYYGWGETKPSSYTSDAYNYEDNPAKLDAEIDAATVNLGTPCRMPTQKEFQELCDNCNWQWATENGVKGYKVTSKKQGYTSNSIFLPASGYCEDGTTYEQGSYGLYWSCSLKLDLHNCAYNLMFTSSNHTTDAFFRHLGLSIRPVAAK